MRAGSTAATIAGAALLMLAGPLSAHAAEGDILWQEPSGRTHAITDPENGSCTTFKDEHDKPVTAARLVNYTDHKVEVYDKAHCGGPSVWTLGAGEEFPEDTAKSVKVWADHEAP